MKLYNTLSRQLEDLEPIHGKKVTMYTCGPTVYDYLQIGNWATFIRWDILARTLKESGYDVNWVMNITDVGHLTSDADEGQDKLEKGAQRESKTAWDIAEFYTQDFLHGLDALNINIPRDNLPKATAHIKEQIALIKKLESKGFTYTIDDGVYFDTSKLPDYGKLAQLKAEGLRAGARVEYNQAKRNPTDFALWKFSPKGVHRNMEWGSPWGTGFPGWHAECSSMAEKYLGKTIDIHGGGIDLIPVHHTNEIAQSEAANGQPLANIWLHSNFITIDGTKLSKSLGNSFTLHDITTRGFNPLDLRMMFLQSHYRTEANFTWEGLEAARNRRLNWQATLDQLAWQNKTGQTTTDMTSYLETILDDLQQDLNTPQALRDIDIMLKEMLTDAYKLESEFPQKFFKFLNSLLGLDFTVENINPEAKTLIHQREAAKDQKDWHKGDQIRNQLEEQGIGLRDTAQGSIWFRTR